ncbi:MAG: class I tRNA ligase family protein, partial [Candidatus Zixiibacteriota bacterium]
MKGYPVKEIESKWQKKWEESGIYGAPEHPEKKYYLLVMYAYPSGDIHIGHFRNFIIGDTVARYKMMHGYQVLHPFGWDAFGLPAELAAMKRKIHPRQWTLENIRVSDSTLKRCGISFDWSREVITCLPDYYKWTQWIFLKLFEHGLA